MKYPLLARALTIAAVAFLVLFPIALIEGGRSDSVEAGGARLFDRRLHFLDGLLEPAVRDQALRLRREIVDLRP